MKKALYLLSVVLLSSASTPAPGRVKSPHTPVGSGVYRSAQDFQQ